MKGQDAKDSKVLDGWRGRDAPAHGLERDAPATGALGTAGEVVAGAFEDTAGDFAGVEASGFDFDVGSGIIHGLTLGEEGFDFFAGVLGVEERPVAVAAGAFEDDIDGGLEPDDVAEVPEQAAVALAGDDAAAGGNDAARGVGGGEFVEHGGFESAEVVFAAGGEDFGDGETGFLLDELVGIDERVAEQVFEFPADGGFPTAHEADQDDVFRKVFPCVHGGELNGAGVRRKEAK